MCVYISVRALSQTNKKENLRYKRKALLTVETALVLPLYLIVMILLMSVTSVYYINSKATAAVNEEAKLLARNLYDNQGMGTSLIESEIVSRLGPEIINCGLIKDGRAGLDFSDTDLTNREIIIVSVKYSISLPFSSYVNTDLEYEKRAIVHAFTGYERGLFSLEEMSDYVYMTENGTVYHRNRQCSHIRLNISAVKGKDIKTLRNNSGAKYKKCIYCHPKLTDPKIYVTSDGDRYHNSLNCSGLKRSVYRVKLASIGDIKPCSRCGY